MDDLDHSMHIAECDWTSFCEDSEECSLPKPSIARHDSSGLSESEDSENSSSVFSADQQELQRVPDVTGDGAEDVAVRSQSCKKQNESGAGGKQGDVSAKSKEKSLTEVECKLCFVWPAGNILDTKEDCIKTAEEMEAVRVSNKLKKQGGHLETLIDHSSKEAEPDPRLCGTELNVKEPSAAEWREDTSRVGSRAEKERWFVTVNDGPRQPAAASSAKRKQRQKSTWSSKQEKSVEKLLAAKDKDKRAFAQLKQNLVQYAEEAPSAKINHRSWQTCCKGENVSQTLSDAHEPDSSRPTTCDTLTCKDPSQMGSAESDALQDGGADFFSIRSRDSESCLSAAESTGDILNHTENRLFSNLTSSHPMNTEHPQSRGVHRGGPALSSNAPASNCGGYEGTGVGPTLEFPSAHRRAKEMPGDNSGDELCVPPDTPGLQKQETFPSASGRSSGRQLRPLPVTSSSEAAGPARPVYGISAFWDKMEKLTINDILQLRAGRITPLGETRETGAPNAHGLPTHRVVLVEDGERRLSDGGPVDTSDVADSDDFTRPDQTKPESSSCEWNSRPDPQHKSVGDDESGLCFGHAWPLEAKRGRVETLPPAPVLSRADTLDKHYQISLPEAFEYFFSEDKAAGESTCAAVRDPEDTSVASAFHCTVCTFSNKTPRSPFHDSQFSKDQTIPIFSCSRPTVRELAFPKPDYVFWTGGRGEEDTSPIGALSHSFSRAGAWGNLLSIRKHDVWCRSSGAWLFPVEDEETPSKRRDPPTPAVAEGRVCSTPARLDKEPAVHRRIWETIHTTKREGVFSTLKQSDMCLVCIAFASWVLRSSDPEAADAWKAALLANVSALSAIQFLRKYVKKTPLQDDT